MNLNEVKRIMLGMKKEQVTEGHLDGWNGYNLWGWAIDDSLKEPVEIEIIINETRKKNIIANQFRQDLQDAGKKQNGKAGFSTILNVHEILYELDFDKENKIEVKNKANGQKLIGSPIIIEKPNIRGNVDYVKSNCMVGWVVNDSYPDSPVIIDLYVNNKFKRKVVADQYREDLSDAGFVNANCGFSIDLTLFSNEHAFTKLELKLSDSEKNIIRNEWILEPLTSKVNALTRLQKLIRKEAEKYHIDHELNWLNSKIMPSLINQLRSSGNFSFDTPYAMQNLYLEDKGKQCIDIIIPVYKGLDETINCIKSVQKAIVEQPYEIIVINDKSPDLELTSLLREMSKDGSFTLLENAENKGFVGTVNRGMQLHTERDVLLLNSDTLTPNHWLDRIVEAAYQDKTIGTVTPFSNNATICSFPKFCVDNSMIHGIDLNEISEIFANENKGLIIDLPTAHGFSMFIKRNVLNEIGYFDEKKWGKGYAEENDFSLRAASRGWRNVLAGDAFVQHLGSVSFAENAESFIAKNLQKLNGIYPDYSANVENFIHQDPVRELRNNVSLSLLKKEVERTEGNKKARGKSILFVSLAFGGGTKVATDDLAELLAKEGQCALMLTSPKPGLWELSSHQTEALVQYKWPEEKSLLIDNLKSLSVWHVHFHHTVQFPKEIWQLPEWLGTAYDVTLHDYYTVCPRINLIDETQSYCGEPPIGGCEQCIKQNGVYDASFIKLKDVGGSVAGWRNFHQGALSKARKVITPSNDTKQRISSHIELDNIEAKYHPEPSRLINLIDFSDAKIINVAFIGAIGTHKGFSILKDCAKYAIKFELPIHFTVIGYTCDDKSLKDLPNITITGKYERQDLPALIKANKCHLAALFSVWPETFSYTLSESFSNNLTPIAFNFGAIHERIKNTRVGVTIDFSASIKSICENIIAMRDTNFSEVDISPSGYEYSSILENYYQL